MNRLKNQLLLAAGFAVLAGVVSGITAAPAIAQAIKAALVKNVDEKGRIPKVVHLQCFIGSSVDYCSDESTPIAANRRFVVEHINGKFDKPNALPWRFFEIFGNNTNQHFVPLFMGTTGSSTSFYSVNEQFEMYFEAGQKPELVVGTNGLPSSNVYADVYLTGYLIDLTI